MKKKIWNLTAWICTFGFFIGLYLGKPWNVWVALLLGALFSAMIADSV